MTQCQMYMSTIVILIFSYCCHDSNTDDSNSQTNRYYWPALIGMHVTITTCMMIYTITCWQLGTNEWIILTIFLWCRTINYTFINNLIFNWYFAFQHIRKPTKDLLSDYNSTESNFQPLHSSMNANTTLLHDQLYVSSQMLYNSMTLM